MSRLIDADALKQHYAWWGDCGEKGEKNKRIFDEIIDQQPTVGEWVSVKERLPQRENDKQMRGWFLVCLESGCVKSLCYEFGSGHDDDLFDVGWEETGTPVKYWQPLPLPPWEK